MNVTSLNINLNKRGSIINNTLLFYKYNFI